MVFGLAVRVEVGGVARNMKSIRTTEIRGAQWYGRRVPDLDVELARSRKDAICRRGIRKGVSRYQRNIDI